MLGEQIGEARGQAISTRVLPDEGHGPRMEVTDLQVGTLYGVNATSTVTYVGTMRPNGTLVGEGTGIVMTADGGSATYRGFGVGKFTKPGAASWRGALFYETQTPELDRLNGLTVLFEYEVDESNKSEGRLFEWK